MGLGQGYPPGRRLRKRREYLAVQGRGQRVSGRHFLVFVRPRGNVAVPPRTRFGITVTRKVGDAVTRNRIKRFVRESCRKLGDQFPADVDVVIVARPTAATASCADTANDLAWVAARLRPGRRH